MVIYGFVASVLPVWLLLAPRDYLSAFMKIGTILVLGVAILLVLPPLRMPAVTQFIDGTGPVFAGKLFPFAFITIACGAISGFHALVSSGTTPKMIRREPDARLVGYGSMLTESLVGVMAMIAAATLDPGVYFAMNVGPAGLGVPETAARAIAQWGFTVQPAELDALAAQMGVHTPVAHRGAPSLAVGMAGILSGLFSGAGLAIWHHFAIMFEAVFILTTIDAGTRVGRFMLQELLGHVGAARSNVLVSEHPPVVVSGCGRLGLLPLSGRCRSSRWHQLALAALWDSESATGGRRALRGHDSAHQDGSHAVFVGHAGAAGLAGDRDADRGMAEGALARSEPRLPGTRAGTRKLQRAQRRG